MFLRSVSFVFIAFFCLNFSIFSQEIIDKNTLTICDIDSRSIYEVDLKTHTLYTFRKDGLSETYPIVFENINVDDMPTEFSVRSFNVNKNQFYISVAGTGQVYLLDLNARVLKRIDRTFYRGYNFSPIQFLRKDTLFSFGGRGFWHLNNIFSYYSKINNDWDYYFTLNYSKGGPSRVFSNLGGYSSIKDKIYAADINDPYQELPLTPVNFYEFDFASQKWSKIGRLNKLDAAFINYKLIDAAWSGQFFISNNFVFADPETNKTYRYNGKNRTFFANSIKWISKRDYLYSFQKQTINQSKFIVLDSIHVDSLLKNSNFLGNFYQPNSIWEELDWDLMIYLFGFIFVFGLITVVYRKKSKRFSNAQTKISELPDHSHEFLKFILNQENNICTTEDLNKILRCSDKSIENQRQIRSKFISTLNTCIENSHNLPESILRIPSEYDKRFINYTVSPNALKVIEQLCN
jgi:hypothetical protein